MGPPSGRWSSASGGGRVDGLDGSGESAFALKPVRKSRGGQAASTAATAASAASEGAGEQKVAHDSGSDSGDDKAAEGTHVGSLGADVSSFAAASDVALRVLQLGNPLLLRLVLRHVARAATPMLYELLLEVLLVVAASLGHVSDCDMLLAAGADPSAPTVTAAFRSPVVRGAPASLRRVVATGTLPLHAAAAGGHVPVMRMLLARGARRQSTNRKGESPLTVAYDARELGAFRCLVRSGADLNARDAQRRTLAHIAAKDGVTDVLRELISAGANVNAQDVVRQQQLSQASHFPLTTASADTLFDCWVLTVLLTTAWSHTTTSRGCCGQSGDSVPPGVLWLLPACQGQVRPHTIAHVSWRQPPRRRNRATHSWGAHRCA